MKLLIFLAAVTTELAISAGFAWFISWGLAFAFGIQLGFLQTWVAMFVIHMISNIVFGGLKSANKEAK